MRKLTFTLAGAIFLVACFLLYSSLDASLSRRKIYFDKGKKDIEVLEAKLQQLESELNKNEELIGQIRSNIYKIAGGGGNAATETKDELSRKKVSVGAVSRGTRLPLDTARRSNTTSVSRSSASCQFASSLTPAAPDVQMLNLYEVLKFDNPDGGVWKQGWDIQYDKVDMEQKQAKLRVFVIPHSHCDPGWLKTFEKYYLDQVKHILDNMVLKLTAEKRMKFIYAEMSFFERWWSDADASKRQAVKELLKSGQFEVATGAWVMTDEANAHYFAMIDQMIEGHQWLGSQLDYRPTHHWSIDPFGLSSTMAYLLKLANFTTMAIQRVHYSVKKQLAHEHQLEFMWRQLWAADSRTDMFCHMFPFYSYDVPHTCGPDPKICCQFDFKRLPGMGVHCPWNVPPVPITDENVASRAEILLDQYRKKSQLYRNNVLLVPLGDDFRYDSEREWDAQFSNYQKLFDYMNAKSEWNVEAKFGTLADYFQALYERTQVAEGARPKDYPALSGDFFTYADRDDHYWSGYYTSRPFSKRMDRVLQHYLRGAEIAYSLGFSAAASSNQEKPFTAIFSKLVEARRNLGIFQHHDGVTGTAKDHVVVDYTQRLLSSIRNCMDVISMSAVYLLSENRKDVSQSDDALQFDLDEHRMTPEVLPDKSVIQVTTEPRQLIVYNSLPFGRSGVVCLAVSSPNVQVRDADGAKTLMQVMPVIYKISDRLEISPAAYEVCFLAHVAAFGLARFQLLSVAVDENARAWLTANFAMNAKDFSVEAFKGDDFEVNGIDYTAYFSSKTGMLKALLPRGGRHRIDLALEFVRYGTTDKPDKSGAYLFLPDGPATTLIASTHNIIHVDGPLFSSVIVALKNVKHVVKIFKVPMLAAQTVNIVNQVDITDEANFEIAMRIHTSVANTDRTFFTDLNGFQILKRKFFGKIPLQGNFYPMPSAAFIEDDKSRVTLLTAQPLGVSSVEAGKLEVVLDRRLMQDDNRGVGQGVTDNKVTPSYFRLVLESVDAAASKTQKTAFLSLLAHFSSLDMLHPVFTLFQKEVKVSAALSKRLSPLGNRTFPCDLHLVNLRTLEAVQEYRETSGPTPLNRPSVQPRREHALIVHRLAHDCRLSAGVAAQCDASGSTKVSLKQLLGDLLEPTAQETSLSLMYKKQELSLEDVLNIEPMDIRTFRVRLK